MQRKRTRENTKKRALRVRMFEDRRGTEINCEGLRVDAGWRGMERGGTGGKDEEIEERERERSG